ncbi:MAG: hypothetical protein FD134_2004 [Gallionellaceae bacterium]|nr:MAG: hypothetical protein FD134_2004 [Gallionellaceae bacterium]
MRQIMLAQRDLDFHAGVGVVAEHLHHAPDGLRVFARLLQDFQHHHLPRFGGAAFAGRNQYVLADAAVLRHHELDAVLFV